MKLHAVFLIVSVLFVHEHHEPWLRCESWHLRSFYKSWRGLQLVVICSASSPVPFAMALRGGCLAWSKTCSEWVKSNEWSVTPWHVFYCFFCCMNPLWAMLDMLWKVCTQSLYLHPSIGTARLHSTKMLSSCLVLSQGDHGRQSGHQLRQGRGQAFLCLHQQRRGPKRNELQNASKSAINLQLIYKVHQNDS